MSLFYSQNYTSFNQSPQSLCFIGSNESDQSNQSDEPNDSDDSDDQSISLEESVHAKAIEVSTRYKRAEAELIDLLIEIEDRKIFLKRGHSSLFKYVVSELHLGENTAYSLITVSRKARQFPVLKASIQNGTITLSNARRVASVLTLQNQEEWISKACELSSRELEKEIAKFKPAEATSERARYVSFDRVKLEIGLSEREMLRLRRVQDLISQSRRRTVSLELVIHELNNLYLGKHDPVEKAKRHQVRNPVDRDQKSADLNLKTESHNQGKGPSESDRSNANRTETFKTLVTKRESVTAKREPLSAAIKHQVNLRDQRRCAHTLPNGSRCNQSRFVEIHHKIPVSQGGRNEVSNLVTLCSAHHRMIHEASPKD
jgi:hypothetical protein